jgi:hypothetical protein
MAVDPGRRAVLALAGADDSGELTYWFTPAEVGTRHGGTAVTVSTQRRPLGLANRLLSFFVAGFVARTAEGALRSELDALAHACLQRGDAETGADAAAA